MKGRPLGCYPILGTSYIIAAMLDEFKKSFSLFAIVFLSNMAKFSLSFKSLENGCTPPICNKQFRVLITHLLSSDEFRQIHVIFVETWQKIFLCLFFPSSIYEKKLLMVISFLPILPPR